MKRDEALEEIWEVRRRISAEHGDDTKALVKYYQELEATVYADRMLPKRPKPIVQAGRGNRTEH